MTLHTFSIIFAGVLLNSVAQLLLKAGAKTLGHVSMGSLASLTAAAWNAGTQPWVLLGLVCYFISAGLWILALTRVDVTVAYPMLSMGYVIAALLAWQIFGEPLTGNRVLGIAIILVGVVVLSRG
ncbi:SMR family transporter [Variovorax sp. JS1663]|uniref:SMR family transporter n=1 Tax=Variovorax sp. JS1663 TaxID=1851577 RepID=UPI000B346933|nr:SMR family transporter [Variovorax sp. JS1663]OUM03755.1 4-amino-4-deoxy-L-arabinose transferase [Variovorax sp. JS1663]